MNEDERTELFMIKYRKHIKNVEIADALNCTPGLISSYFNGRTNMSKEKQEKLKNFIENFPEYATFKVQIKSSK